MIAHRQNSRRKIHILLSHKIRTALIDGTGRGGEARTPSRGFGDHWFTINRHPCIKEGVPPCIAKLLWSHLHSDGPT